MKVSITVCKQNIISIITSSCFLKSHVCIYTFRNHIPIHDKLKFSIKYANQQKVINFQYCKASCTMLNLKV